MEYLETFRIELINRNYARNTQKIYLRSANFFIDYIYKTMKMDPEERILRFLDTLSSSIEARKQAYSAVKLLYQLVFKKRLSLCFRPRKEKKTSSCSPD